MIRSDNKLNLGRYAVEVVERHDQRGVWTVEAIDQDGSIFQALFPGPRSKERALEYAEWKDGQNFTSSSI